MLRVVLGCFGGAVEAAELFADVIDIFIQGSLEIFFTSMACYVLLI